MELFCKTWTFFNELFRIYESVIGYIFQYFHTVFPGKISGHRKIHIQIVPAVFWGSTGNLTFKISNKIKKR